MKTQLLKEIVEQIKEELPEMWSFSQFVLNADRLQVCTFEEVDCISLVYQWGQLLGAAQWEGLSVEELLAKHSVAIIWKDEVSPECGCEGCGCEGFDHFNIGEYNEGIQRCDECAVFDDDDAAKRAHDQHCKCGAGVGPGMQAWIKRCHHCKVESPSAAFISGGRAFCSALCAAQNSVEVSS